MNRPDPYLRIPAVRPGGAAFFVVFVRRAVRAVLMLAFLFAAGTWTSNADAYFCELCGEFVLAARVRTARAAYRAKQEQERKEREAREEKEKQEREEAERQEREQQLEQAERDLRAGLFIAPAYFEQLAEKYGVSLPIKFVGWLRKWCGRIRLKVDTEYGGYTTQYFCNKNHKSTSIGTYGNALGKAMGI